MSSLLLNGYRVLVICNFFISTPSTFGIFPLVLSGLSAVIPGLLGDSRGVVAGSLWGSLIDYNFELLVLFIMFTVLRISLAFFEIKFTFYFFI